MIDPKVTGQAVTFGPCRLSYVHVFAKYKFDGEQGEGKYMCNILIPKSEKATVNAIRKAIDAAKNKGLTNPKCWAGKMPKNCADPLKDGDLADEKDQAVYGGHWYLNAKSNTKPLLLDRDKTPLTDEDDLYSGAWGIASVSFYAYSNAGNNGVGCGLSGIMKYKDDDRLGGSNDQAKSDLMGLDFDDETDDEL